MASIRITQFAGLMPEVHGRLINHTNAQIAHNCVLTDGSLRPYAKWIEIDVRDLETPPYMGIAYDYSTGKTTQYKAFDPVTLSGPPFAANITIGPLSEINSHLVRFYTGDGAGYANTGIGNIGITANISYTRAFDSIKPVNRLYAVSQVRKYGDSIEEGPLYLLGGQSPSDILYEGDLVRIEFAVTGVSDGVNYMRLYRTITGLDTGQAITNELDTNWHLVAEMQLFLGGQTVYVDGASATALPLDVYHAAEFHDLVINTRFFGLTESGWFTAVSESGEIAISERYRHHAWPTQNYLKIPEKVTDAVVHMDNIYIGTQQRPYIASISQGDKAMQAAIVPFGESTACLPNTMTATASGAMYASGQGLVALGREGMQVVTKDIANAGSIFAVRALAMDENVTPVMQRFEFGIGKTSFGLYHNGKYYGFCDVPPIPYTPV